MQNVPEFYVIVHTSPLKTRVLQFVVSKVKNVACVWVCVEGVGVWGCVQCMACACETLHWTYISDPILQRICASGCIDREVTPFPPPSSLLPRLSSSLLPCLSSSLFPPPLSLLLPPRFSLLSSPLQPRKEPQSAGVSPNFLEPIRYCGSSQREGPSLQVGRGDLSSLASPVEQVPAGGEGPAHRLP